jgi:hypothetical protein
VPGGGRIDEAPGETWTYVDEALRSGHRGFAPGSSLARLLAAERSVRNKQDRPRFSRPQILAWAVSHHQRTGRWPSAKSGPILEAPDENWRKSGRSLARRLARLARWIDSGAALDPGARRGLGPLSCCFQPPAEFSSVYRKCYFSCKGVCG